MKVAYLILAHSNPELLVRLVRAIRAPWADIYIHVDRKAKAASFREALAGETVHFLESRVAVHWGGWSMFMATAALLQTAMARHEYRYYKILSPSCHPIKSRDYIANFFAQQEANFFHLWPPEDGLQSLIDYCHPVDQIPIENFLRPDRFRAHPLREFLRHPIQIGFWGLFYFCAHNHPRLRRFVPRPRIRPSRDCHWGNAWWCLRHDFVVFMLEYLREHPETVRFFKYTRSPEEIVVPTLLKWSGHPHRSIKLHFNHDFTAMSSLAERGEMSYVHMDPYMLFGRKLDDDVLATLRQDWQVMMDDPAMRALVADTAVW